METYVPVKPDWSDLNETIHKLLANLKDYEYIIDNARKKVVEMYSYENVCMYWYNFFANLSGVENE
jgi:glycosyltransferase involved in cell wall biosynthesis